MANFKVKQGITIGANGITFSDGSIQTQAAASNTTGSSSNTVNTLVLRDSAGGFSAGAIIGESFTGNLNASNIVSGTISNARTTASSSNGASTIVARDAAGAFAAGAITGTSFIGDGSSLTSLNASNVSSGTLSNARTTASASNGASTIVTRDAAGAFAAGAITGTTITATTFSGDGSSLTSIPNSATTASASNGASTIVARDAAGSFSANGITVGSNGIVFSDGTTQTSLRPKVNALGSISGARTILLSNGNFVTATATGAVQWSIANTSGGSSFADIVVLELTNGGAGTQTWMTGTKWPSGTAPTLQASGVDVLAFVSDDNGTTWRGALNMSNSS